MNVTDSEKSSGATERIAAEDLVRIRSGGQPTEGRTASALNSLPSDDAMKTIVARPDNSALSEDIGAASLGSAAIPARIGDYEIVSELGRGGMGVVYEAVQHPLGRRVALKLMTHHLAARSGAVERFRREATMTARLAHPAVCPVYDAGVADGVPYIAMQLLHGETLARKIGRRRLEIPSLSRVTSPPQRGGRTAPSSPPTPNEPPPTIESQPRRSSEANVPFRPADERDIPLVCEWIERAARGLHAAHVAGILHRDVKPGNIMITDAGDPIVLDFGLAREMDDSDGAITLTGDVVGTPAYLSPEQIRGDRLDARTDIYSLGVTLYEALVGRRPFVGATNEMMYDSVLRRDPESVRRLNRKISRDLETVVGVALSKSKVGRYASALDFADDLARVRTGQPILARPPGLVRVLSAWIRRHPAQSALFAATVLLLAIGSLFFGYWWATRDDVAAVRREADWLAAEQKIAEGFLFIGITDVDRATPIFEEAIRTHPDPEAVAGLALAYFDAGRAADAERLIVAHRESMPDVAAIDWIYANVLEALGKNDEAKKIAASAKEPRKSVDRFLRGLTYLQKAQPGDREAARSAWSDFTDAVAGSPRQRQIHHVLRVRAAGLTHDPDLLKRSIDALVLGWEKSWITWHAIGQAEESIGDYAAATDAYEKSVAYDPSVVDAWARLAVSAGRSNRPDRALEAAERALEIDPASDRSRFAHAIVLDGRNDPSCRDAYRRVIEEFPTLMTAYTNLARLLRADGKFDEAEALVEKAFTVRKDEPNVWFIAGMLASDRGDPKDAVEKIRKALEIAPSNPSFNHGLAVALNQLDDTEGAIEAARRAYRLAPNDALFAYTLGALISDEGPVDEAEESLRAAVRLEPENAQAKCMLGRVMMRQELWEEALGWIKKGRAQGGLPPVLDEDAAAWEKICLREMDR